MHRIVMWICALAMLALASPYAEPHLVAGLVALAPSVPPDFVASLVDVTSAAAVLAVLCFAYLEALPTVVAKLCLIGAAAVVLWLIGIETVLFGAFALTFGVSISAVPWAFVLTAHLVILGFLAFALWRPAAAAEEILSELATGSPDFTP